MLKKILIAYAVEAYKEVFAGQDEIDLLLIDARLVFSVLFWDGQDLGGSRVHLLHE